MEINIHSLKNALSGYPTENNPYHLPTNATYFDILLNQKYGNPNDYAEWFHGDWEETVKFLTQRLIELDQIYICDPMTGEMVNWNAVGVNLNTPY